MNEIKLAFGIRYKICAHLTSLAAVNYFDRQTFNKHKSAQFAKSKKKKSKEKRTKTMTKLFHFTCNINKSDSDSHSKSKPKTNKMFLSNIICNQNLYIHYIYIDKNKELKQLLINILRK